MSSRPIVLAVIAVVLGGYALISRMESSLAPSPKVSASALPDKAKSGAALRVVEMQSDPSAVAPPAPEAVPAPSPEMALPPVTAKPEALKPAPPPLPKVAGPKGSKKSPLSAYAMMARGALDFVGADPDAELLWATAINDPTLPADTRQDLIEDLNESGFSDPKKLSADDLPLIESRLNLIEALAPFAMDDTNLDAFAEAYKDLLNMQAKLTKP